MYDTINRRIKLALACARHRRQSIQPTRSQRHVDMSSAPLLLEHSSDPTRRVADVSCGYDAPSRVTASSVLAIDHKRPGRRSRQTRSTLFVLLLGACKAARLGAVDHTASQSKLGVRIIRICKAISLVRVFHDVNIPGHWTCGIGSAVAQDSILEDECYSGSPIDFFYRSRLLSS